MTQRKPIAEAYVLSTQLDCLNLSRLSDPVSSPHIAARVRRTHVVPGVSSTSNSGNDVVCCQRISQRSRLAAAPAEPLLGEHLRSCLLVLPATAGDLVLSAAWAWARAAAHQAGTHVYGHGNVTLPSSASGRGSGHDPETARKSDPERVAGCVVMIRT